MKSMKNQCGSVLVFATLMIVLLLVMVGIGLDTGWITYVRGLGQPAVDAAALAGASALPTGGWPTEVENRVKAFNATNDYAQSSGNPLTKNNITGIVWDPLTGFINQAAGPNIPNGIRVALETNNPYDFSKRDNAINAPLFLTPLFNVLGISMAKTTNINVSAVAVLQGVPNLPMAIAGCPPADAATRCATWDSNGATKCQLALNPATTDDSGWTTFNVPPASSEAVQALITEPATCSGKIPPVEVGSKICLGNGTVRPVLNELQTFYSTNGDGLRGLTDPAAPYPNDCALIPVVASTVTSFNHCDEPVVSFAKLCIRDVQMTSPKYVYGDITCNQSLFYNPNVGNNGAKCFVPRLVREKKSPTCATCSM